MVECSSNVVNSQHFKTESGIRQTISIDVTTHHTWYSSTTLERKKSLSLVTTTFPRLRSSQLNITRKGRTTGSFLKFSCREKVGANCSCCKEWTGPLIDRCPKPFPDHSCLPKYHYLPYNNTPREGRNPDNWQPRVQLKKERSSGRLVLSDSESVAAFSDKFIVKPKFVVEHLKHLEGVDFKKKKRAEERAKESQKAREKNYEDYASKDFMQRSDKITKASGARA